MLHHWQHRRMRTLRTMDLAIVGCIAQGFGRVRGPHRSSPFRSWHHRPSSLCGRSVRSLQQEMVLYAMPTRRRSLACLSVCDWRRPLPIVGGSWALSSLCRGHRQSHFRRSRGHRCERAPDGNGPSELLSGALLLAAISESYARYRAWLPAASGPLGRGVAS